MDLFIGEVIKGWDEGIATMKRGEKAILTCSPEYAYGASGSPPKIPPNSTLEFEVRNLETVKKEKDYFHCQCKNTLLCQFYVYCS